jgi:hypothetical protein
MNGLRNQIRTGAAIAATVAGLMLCVTPACAAANGQVLENDGDVCGTGHSPLVVYEPISDANEEESSRMLKDATPFADASSVAPGDGVGLLRSKHSQNRA